MGALSHQPTPRKLTQHTNINLHGMTVLFFNTYWHKWSAQNPSSIPHPPEEKFPREFVY